MNKLVAWASHVAAVGGGPGLFLVAFLDASVLSLPEINDLLVIGMVMAHKDRLLYYASMATLGSVAGCFLLYFLARAGGEALLRKRFAASRVDRGMATFRRYGLLALLVPAILPPPAPFKIFVLLAGVARVRLSTFALAIGVGRGVRYFAEGFLAVWYGDRAVEYLQDHGAEAALVTAGVVLVAGVGYVVWRRRHPAVPHSGAGLDPR
jgi:membrane protein YqaA with SNARE-associated domain